MTGHGVGEAQAEPDQAATATRTAAEAAETQAHLTRGGGPDARSDLGLTPQPGSDAVPSLPPASEPAPLFKVTTRAPDGHVVAVEVVDHEQLDWRLPALLFVTDQLAGWSVTSEPVT